MDKQEDSAREPRTSKCGKACNVVYDFSSLAKGDAYSVSDVINVADATIQFTQFQLADGTWTTNGNAKVVMSTFAAGSPTKELNLNNIMMRVIANTSAVSVSFKYADLGGNVNLGVNGDHRNSDDLIQLNGSVVGDCDISVTKIPIFGGHRGEVEITPHTGITIERFGVGGQEFYIDDICLKW